MSTSVEQKVEALQEFNKTVFSFRPNPTSTEDKLKALKEENKTAHFFKIDTFSLLKKHQIKMIESSVFTLGGHKWQITVYPNGYRGDANHVSIIVEKKALMHVKLECELFLVNQRGTIWHSQGKTVLPPESKWKGVSELISHADLESKGYLIGDCCMFGVRFYGIEPAKTGTAECFRIIEKPLNHKVTWMMTKFSSFNPETAHHSNEFVVGTRKWKIQVYPRGCKSGKDKSLSVFLVGEGFIDNVPNANTCAKFKLRVLDQVNRDHLEKTHFGWLGAQPEVTHGFVDFMPLEKLVEPYLVKDMFYVGVDFDFISVTNYC